MDESFDTAWDKMLIQYQDQLLALAERYLNPVLQQRLSPEDVVQEVFARAYKRGDFFEQSTDVPFFFKLRHLFFQTIKDIERKHLRSSRRDAYKDAPLMDGEPTSAGGVRLEQMQEECAGPMTLVAREDKYLLLRAALEDLPENDRQIIEMRHFDDCSNEQCAELLQITPKAASIRYIRALERLQVQLLKFTEFHP